MTEKQKIETEILSLMERNKGFKVDISATIQDDGICVEAGAEGNNIPKDENEMRAALLILYLTISNACKDKIRELNTEI